MKFQALRNIISKKPPIRKTKPLSLSHGLNNEMGRGTNNSPEMRKRGKRTESVDITEVLDKKTREICRRGGTSADYRDSKGSIRSTRGYLQKVKSRKKELYHRDYDPDDIYDTVRDEWTQKG